MAIRTVTAQIEQLAVTPGAAIYTTPGLTTSTITQAVAKNTDTSNVVNLVVEVNSGGGLEEYINKNIPAGESYLCPEITGLGLETTDIVQAFAGSASDINLKLTIKEVT